MARLSRIVIPGAPHHVTQRENRRLPVFFSDDGRNEDLRLVAEAAAASQARYPAWCLMGNHRHPILVPPREYRLAGSDHGRAPHS